MIVDRGTTATDPDPALGELFGRLRDDAMFAARAEIAVHKAKLSRTAGVVKQVAIFGIAAAVIALAALVTLLVGLVLSLATLVGPLAATAIVVVAALLLAGALAMTAQRHLADMGDPL